MRRRCGQTATEYMLVISVVVIAAVSAAWTFVPAFQDGVRDLGGDVQRMLGTGAAARAGAGGGGDPSAGGCETGGGCGGEPRGAPGDAG